MDVEQIMRDIRARIAQRQGIDLSNQQIQDLAARRLESILDPRAIKPSLLEGLRRSTGVAPSSAVPAASSEPVYTFEDTTIYDSHRGLLRFMRKLLNPLLKLFFNPNPLIRALHLQARLNVEAAEREADRDRRQMEWNALHYEIVQRMVTDVSRLSLEMQSIGQQLESLSAKVDFTDRRVRSVEGLTVTARPAARQPEAVPAAPPLSEGAPPPENAAEGASPDASLRRRRRRRGRRGGTGQPEFGQPAPAQESPAAEHAAEGPAPTYGEDDLAPDAADSAEAPTAGPVEVFGGAQESSAPQQLPQAAETPVPEAASPADASDSHPDRREP